MARRPRACKTPQELIRDQKKKAELKAVKLTAGKDSSLAPAADTAEASRGSETDQGEKRGREETTVAASSSPRRVKKSSKKAPGGMASTAVVDLEALGPLTELDKGKRVVGERDAGDISILGWKSDLSPRWANYTGFEPEALRNFHRSDDWRPDSDVTRHIGEACQIPARLWTLSDHENASRINPMDRLTMRMIMVGKGLSYLTVVEPSKLHSNEEINSLKENLFVAEEKAEKQAFEIQTMKGELHSEKINHQLLEGRFKDTDSHLIAAQSRLLSYEHEN